MLVCACLVARILPGRNEPNFSVLTIDIIRPVVAGMAFDQGCRARQQRLGRRVLLQNRTAQYGDFGL